MMYALRVGMLMSLLAACGGGGSSSGSAASSAVPGADCSMSAHAPQLQVSGSIHQLEVAPSQANSCVTTADSPHQVYWDVQATPKARLAVFLPGTGGLPSDYPGYLRHGATRGYHVIGLTYPNPESVRVICNRAGGDSNCAGLVREEMLTGRNVSDLVATAPADAIEQRLVDLLKYLRRHRPDQPWSQYLTRVDMVDWSKVSVSGHSQGAGHAGYIGKTRLVFQVGMYAGPSDWVDRSNQPAAWFGLPGLTPDSAFYGLIHASDPLANYTGNPQQVVQVWADSAGFRMTGSLVDVMSTAAPFAGSQRLIISQGCTATVWSNTDLERHNCPMYRGMEAAWNVVGFP